ncbi:hypothetical protein KBA73_02805 [Patescibacteria group bacterium]|nr:hypothetical protein [Patescibacteria group bacterium]
MRQDLLEDRPLDPRIEKSELGMELFNSMIPDAGQYRAVDDRASLLKTVGDNTSILRVDACYKPSSKLVHVAEQESVSLEKGESSPAEQAIRLRQQIIEKKYNEESMQKFLSGWQESARLLDEEPSDSSRTYWFSIILDRWQTNLATQQQSLEAIKNPHGRAARQKEIERLEQAIVKITALMERDQHDALEEPSTERLLEELQSIFVTKEGKIDRVELEKQAGDVARGLLIARMAEHSHAHYMAMQEARRRQAGQKLISKESVDAWERWFREEYLEHFSGVNPKVDVGLSPSTLLLANKLWRIDGLTAKIEQTKTDPGSGPIGHPLIDAFLVIQRAKQEVARLQRNERAGEQKPLEFWPVKGIGRVLAGDIANACYHSHRQVLAEGGHQKITALLMTIPGETEIAGSTLLIDTKTLSGKRVLVIRALNPTDAIIRKSLDAQAVVEATIEYAKEAALATQGDEDPIQEIRICHDHVGGHSTNRLEVFNAEAVLVATNRWTTGEDLIDVPETNFNGYDVHSARQTRVVWSGT